jgi:ABC-2 type transport system permease protein
MSTPAPPPSPAQIDERRTPGATFALYRLMLRTVVTRARVLSIGALGLVGVIVGAAIGRVHNFEHVHRGAQFLNAFGLSLLVPVATLVFASAALGDPTEDGTLVYIWLRPVARWRITVAAAAAAYTVTWPVVTIPLAVTAALAGRNVSLVTGTIAAVTVAMTAYIGLFLALGLRVKRALVWGLLYIFIWEGFVATANVTAARLAVRTYGRSVLEQISHTHLRPTDISAPWSWIVPPLVAMVALAYAQRRLSRQDVE